MPSRDTSPPGAPCWADLWTSDVPAARTFYCELFGWEAEDPIPEFGGYFNFTRDGVWIAGCMGDMGEIKANNTWKPYLATYDIDRAVAAAQAQGAQLLGPPMPVADLGVQAVLVDPTGAQLGAWQPGTHTGFTVLGEPGAPSWFELHTRDHARAVVFYRSVFDWDTNPVADTDEFRYTTMRDPTGGEDLAGIMDASAFLPADASPAWSIYWHTDDIDATATRVTALGGTVVQAPEDTPYGRLAGCTDPAGAWFKLRTP